MLDYSDCWTFLRGHGTSEVWDLVIDDALVLDMV